MRLLVADHHLAYKFRCRVRFPAVAKWKGRLERESRADSPNVVVGSDCALGVAEMRQNAGVVDLR
jgi:hypothetical protein